MKLDRTTDLIWFTESNRQDGPQFAAIIFARQIWGILYLVPLHKLEALLSRIHISLNRSFLFFISLSDSLPFFFVSLSLTLSHSLSLSLSHSLSLSLTLSLSLSFSLTLSLSLLVSLSLSFSLSFSLSELSCMMVGQVSRHLHVHHRYDIVEHLFILNCSFVSSFLAL